MNLRQLEYFKTLADLQHMTQTAELLNTTQPNLSHSMSELEKELEAKLFEKVGRNIRLTRYGKFFYKYVDNALKELANGEQALKELISPETGTVDLGFIYTAGSYLAPSLIKHFRALPNNQNIRFNLSQGNSFEMIDLLLSNEIDLAITSKIKNSEQLDYTILAEQEIVLVTPLDHPLASKDQLWLKETKNCDFVHFNQDSGLRPHVDQLLDEVHVVPNITVEVEEDHTMLGFVSQGFGVALMPRIQTINSYEVKVIKLKDDLIPRYIYLASLKGQELTAATLKFKHFILANTFSS
ncbi:LysR family transcriptional regulator [Vagococcus sp. BWB3-3]|uniref:LysR family transcriptional regulator n=1 Tax=Vagococcus allomyrinae TaxID=2794353 RepID=A0A940PD44_9ENTE|nr:LysR family transcriptional regulator [Vagococcus allomyrinae]MBP1041748.1 LysR family transcriptional regulator [Vagococcus allomyrinae]